MGEIGSGSGSAYPAALDTGATQEQASDYVRLDWGRDVEAAIVAVENELGTDPAGSYATVRARLDAISSGSGGVSHGLASARPAAADGTWYYSTDLGILEVSTGTEWLAVLAGGS